MLCLYFIVLTECREWRDFCVAQSCPSFKQWIPWSILLGCVLIHNSCLLPVGGMRVLNKHKNHKETHDIFTMNGLPVYLDTVIIMDGKISWWYCMSGYTVIPTRQVLCLFTAEDAKLCQTLLLKCTHLFSTHDLCFTVCKAPFYFRWNVLYSYNLISAEASHLYDSQYLVVLHRNLAENYCNTRFIKEKGECVSEIIHMLTRISVPPLLFHKSFFPLFYAALSLWVKAATCCGSDKMMYNSTSSHSKLISDMKTQTSLRIIGQWIF